MNLAKNVSIRELFVKQKNNQMLNLKDGHYL
jgi:hypothetical protein